VNAEFSPDQEALRESVRRFLAERAPLGWVRTMLDDPRGTSDDVWQGLGSMGVLGLLVDGSMVDAGVVLEELGRAAFPGPYLGSAVGAVSVLSLARGEDTLLASLCDGTCIGAVVLDGVALGGAAADVFVVHDERGWRVVDREHATVKPVETIDGTRTRASVSAEGGRALAGDPDPGEVRDRMCTALAVDGIGAASAALDIAVGYAKERIQFGKPIGSFQAVQHLCAEMLQQLELARAGAYYALWACDAAGPAERHRAATMAKAYCGDVLWRIGAGAIQVLGGVGFTWEHDAHLFYKRLLSLQQDLGSPGHHLDELAAIILE
jgi:alkylation response protein AidB-like acyl-CoA dehydrogenase